MQSLNVKLKSKQPKQNMKKSRKSSRKGNFEQKVTP